MRAYRHWREVTGVDLVNALRNASMVAPHILLGSVAAMISATGSRHAPEIESPLEGRAAIVLLGAPLRGCGEGEQLGAVLSLPSISENRTKGAS